MPLRTDNSIATSLTLIERVRAQDKCAWGVFAKLYAPVLYGWCRSCGLQDADAADVAQDVLVIVAAKIESFQRENPGQSLRAWMRTITKNKCRDLIRARKRHATAAGGTDAQVMMGEILEPSADIEPDDGGFDDEAAVIQSAIEILRVEFEDRTWQAFVQTAIDGRKAADVAADLNMTVGNVYTAKSRVLSRLRTEFAELL